MQRKNQKLLFLALVVVAAMVYFAPFLMFMIAVVPVTLFVGFLVLRKLAK